MSMQIGKGAKSVGKANQNFICVKKSGKGISLPIQLWTNPWAFVRMYYFTQCHQEIENIVRKKCP